MLVGSPTFEWEKLCRLIWGRYHYTNISCSRHSIPSLTDLTPSDKWRIHTLRHSIIVYQPIWWFKRTYLLIFRKVNTIFGERGSWRLIFLLLDQSIQHWLLLFFVGLNEDHQENQDQCTGERSVLFLFFRMYVFFRVVDLHYILSIWHAIFYRDDPLLLTWCPPDNWGIYSASSLTSQAIYFSQLSTPTIAL